MTASAAGAPSVRHGPADARDRQPFGRSPVATPVCLRTGRLVATQVAVVAVLIGALAGTGVLAAAVAGAIVLLALAWLRPRGRWASAWLATAVRYATRRHTAPAGGPAALLAFVAPGAGVEAAGPPGARVEAAGPPGDELTMIADAHGVTAVLELGDPARLLVEDLPSLPHLGSLLPGADAEQPPVRVQLVLTGAPAPATRAGTGPPAMSYRQLTEGRLPAYGRALLAVRVLRSEEWTDDDLRRALVSQVRRLPRRLGRLPARPLGTAAVLGVIAELAHDDGRTPPREGWASLRIGGLAQASFRLDHLPDPRPEALRRLVARMLAVPATATTVALTAGPGATTLIDVRVAAQDSAGLAAAAHALRLVVSAERGRLRRLDGDHLDGLAATLPLGGERRLDIPGRTPRPGLPAGVLDGLDLTTGGAGLMLGRDRHGQPVVARLFRPEETRALLVGGIRCAQLVTLRAMAAGARVVVQTARPNAWEPFVRGIAGPSESIIILPSGRTTEIPSGSALSPVLAVVDVGAAGVDDQPGYGWQAMLTVRDEVLSADVDAASRADFLVLQRLREDEAALLRDALGLGDAAEWLTKIRPDMVGLVNRQAVRWAALAQTPIEHQLIGPAARTT